MGTRPPPRLPGRGPPAPDEEDADDELCSSFFVVTEVLSFRLRRELFSTTPTELAAALSNIALRMPPLGLAPPCKGLPDSRSIRPPPG